MAISTCKELYDQYRTYVKNESYELSRFPNGKINEEEIREVFPLLIDICNRCQKDSSEIGKIKLDESKITEALKDYYNVVIDEIHKNGVTKEQLAFFDSIIDKIIKSKYKQLYCHESLERIIKIEEIEPSNITDIEAISEILKDKLKELANRNKWDIAKEIDMTAHIYEKLVPDDLKNNPDLIKAIIKKQPEHVGYFLKYVKDQDSLDMINTEYVYITQYMKKSLSKEDYEYILKLYNKYGGDYVPEGLSNALYTMYKQKNVLVNKLRTKYGKSYEEYAKKQGINPEDNEKFMLTMLNSNVLADIHLKEGFTSQDIKDLNDIIAAFVYDGVDCSKIKERQKQAYDIGLRREMDVHDYLVRNRNKDKELDNILEKLNITKDNFFDYVKSRKYLVSDLKTTELMILSQYFKCNYISVYDILVLIQEMGEKHFTIDEILQEKELDKKIFYDFYNQTKTSNPVIYELIRKALAHNSARGFKKLCNLYCSICENEFKDRKAFINKYNKTPEEILLLFSNSPFYDDVYLKISSLCEKTIEEENIKKM